ncbi:MAG: NYN domain-containing protein [Dehalococcoidia bacterium]|nr:NYN domain-containing protein [Dehalococcoidia bacterium]
MDERVAIFIDGSNLYHALKNNFKRQDLNFTEFANKLCGGRRLFRIYYYNVGQDPAQYPEGYREQQEFIEVLRKTPYLEVRLGGMKKAQGIPVEKGVDIMLATDLLYFAYGGFYDVAVLVSGDADFAYAMQAVKNMGKHVEVAYFESGVSKDLLDVADNRHLLNREFFKDLWASQRRSQRRRVTPRSRGIYQGQPQQQQSQTQAQPPQSQSQAQPPQSQSPPYQF